MCGQNCGLIYYYPNRNVLDDARYVSNLETPNAAGSDMSLSFPNRSRSFDATRRAVRFWGYDTAMERSFFVTEDALKYVQPSMRFDEVGLLGAFDSNRELSYGAATRVYARGRRGSYEVTPNDF